MPATISTERWTYDDMVEKLPAESRYELRDYNLLEMPSPKPKHQNIVFTIGKQLDSYVRENKLGKTFFSPLDVVFQKGDSVQPDLIFVATENLGIIKESYISGVPDLLVEVVSKGSVARDYVEKKNDYEKFGVKEYWIIDSLNETIWIYAQNETSKYELFSYAEEGEKALSKLFTDFSLDHDIIFEE
ncbi:MAG: Uma2 family endonuclease [Emticicia sp.]